MVLPKNNGGTRFNLILFILLVHSRIHKLVYVSRNVFGGTISDGLLAEITYFTPPLELGIRSLIR